MQRLQMIDQHAVTHASTKPASKANPTLNVWESMGYDHLLSTKAVDMRKAAAKMMDENMEEINKHVDESRIPTFMMDKIKAIGINGLQIKGYGSPGLTTLEAGAIMNEIAKKDGSVATFFLVHNAIGMAVVDRLGDEE